MALAYGEVAVKRSCIHELIKAAWQLALVAEGQKKMSVIIYKVDYKQYSKVQRGISVKCLRLRQLGAVDWNMP